MTSRHPMSLLLPALAITMALGLAAAAQAQTNASVQVTFGHTPRWVGVPGTRVREIRTVDRPDYDMFNYGGSYYVYRNNQWYSSRHGRGHFNAIDERRVPMQISRVPRDHWHNYPSGWQDENPGPHQHMAPGNGMDNHRH